MTGTEHDRARQQEITTVVIKVLAVALAVGLAIGGGAWLMVKAIGLDSADVANLGPSQVEPLTPLPTTALPNPSDSASATPSDGLTTPAAPGTGSLYLNASPVFVKPMEKIYLTGQWPGHDNEGLMVQRFENGAWTDFGVQVQLNVGTFSTYVMTGHTGDQKFRVLEPSTNTTSNEVQVTVQ